MTVDLHERYNLRRVINACGKMTSLCGAAVLPEIVETVAESMQRFWELDALQAAAGKVIAEATSAESGCVTACTSSGITLAIAAAMTGNDLGKVLQLPDSTGMPSRVLIQKGHCVNYGAPVTQAIRLAGATVVEMGTVNGCTQDEVLHELRKGDVAAVLSVESHHTVQYGWIEVPRMVELAQPFGVPVIVDGAAQDLRFQELVGYGADLVIASAHKFLCSTTAGVVAGRKKLVDAVYLQNRGIGRGMKAGKEAIFGAMAALEYRMKQDIQSWTAEQDRRVDLILELLKDEERIELSVDPDPNGCPYSRVRISIDPQRAGMSAADLTTALAAGDPTIVARAHHVDEGFIHLDSIELTDDDIRYMCDRVRKILNGSH